MAKQTLEERFLDRCLPEPNSGCWLWGGSWFPKTGYGQIKVRGKPEGAHRVSWELHCGPVPQGLCVLHKCDVRPCVNPAHLFLGTHRDNTADMFRKRRANTAHSERHGKVKLTAEQVRAIRESTRSQREDALAFGVHPSSISLIKAGKNWRHLPNSGAE